MLPNLKRHKATCNKVGRRPRTPVVRVHRDRKYPRRHRALTNRTPGKPQLERQWHQNNSYMEFRRQPRRVQRLLRASRNVSTPFQFVLRFWSVLLLQSEQSLVPLWRVRVVRIEVARLSFGQVIEKKWNPSPRDR